jgi:hypothetical protein
MAASASPFTAKELGMTGRQIFEIAMHGGKNPCAIREIAALA